ncbi:MAG TPA: YceI family protein, partial [Nitrospiraceae bacterium]|nr:YceI family protein [Nitrospiraceae bacterium]
MKTDKALVILLRSVGVTALFALVAVFLPMSWMAATHRWLGLGEMPSAPVLEYLGFRRACPAGPPFCMIIRELANCSGWEEERMSTWIFEPGHTAAELCVRHMMVTWVRGHFKDVHGSLEFDPENPATLSMAATITAAGIWTGEPQRDEHLRSADFLDVVNHPAITFQSTKSERTGGSDYLLTGELAIRGITRPVVLSLRYLGRWRTPYNDARVTRVGFTGETTINRHDFGVSWNSSLENAGSVVGSEVLITLDAEAILEAELRPILDRGSTS